MLNNRNIGNDISQGIDAQFIFKVLTLYIYIGDMTPQVGVT